jgi:glucokinase
MSAKRYVLGIELGGGHATCGLANAQGVVDSHTIDVSASSRLSPLLLRFQEILDRLLSANRANIDECAGVGMAFCGLVDAQRNRPWCLGSKYDDAIDLDLESWSRERFGLPFRMENDVRLALLGESIAGAAKGCQDVVMVTLGTGFGTAAIMQGQVVQGRHSLAAARGGHFSITLAQTPCFCGNIGCVETEASTWYLSEISKRPQFSGSSEQPNQVFSDFRSLLRATEIRHAGAEKLLDHCIHVWGAATLTMAYAYDADTIVVGGGVMRASNLILPRLTAYIHDHAWTPWGKLDVRSSLLGEYAAILGLTTLFDLSA